MKLATLAVVILALGIVLGLGLQATVFEAEAKPPPPEPPTPQPVLEQNLDADGFIAVHEQGVADVNVVSMPSQPIIDRVIVFAQNETGGAGGTYLSDALDTNGCSLTEVFLDFASANIDGYTIIIHESTDGTNRFPLRISVGGAGGHILDNEKWSWGSPAMADWVFVEVRGLGAQVLEEGVLHCENASAQ